jgi:hypothetical protein
MKLDFKANGTAKCSQSGKVYKLENGRVELAG